MSKKVYQKLIASKEVYAPQFYVELMTGKFYTSGAINNESIVDDIMFLLEENEIFDIKSFALDDIEKAIADGKRLVLVDCVHYRMDLVIPEFRWFQINDDTVVEEHSILDEVPTLYDIPL